MAAEGEMARHSQDVLDVGRIKQPIIVKLPTRGRSTSDVASDSSSENVPFSIFTLREKWALVVMASAGAFFSPMTATIYYPAIPLLATDFRVSISIINLTVTIYLIFQGITPMFWAPIADMKGRRPTFLGGSPMLTRATPDSEDFLACLLLLSITCIGLAHVPMNKVWVLLFLRALQAAGSASTVALCYGVVADIAVPAERGGFMGISGIGMLVAPCIGPVIGGAIAASLGRRGIFWFLCIASGVCFGTIFLLFPETLRRIVGDGSILAPWWNRPLIPIIGPLGRKAASLDAIAKTESLVRLRYNPFHLLLQLDVVLMFIANGVVYCVFISMQTSLSLLVQDAYPFLGQTAIGLCFLPMGLGTLFSSLITGKVLDWQYKRERTNWEQERRNCRGVAGADPDVLITQEEELTFPIERVRLKWAMGSSVLVSCVSVGFGWALDKRAPLAITLVFQFLCGYAVIWQMTLFQTLLIDNFPKQGSSTTAI
ncbi:hypothetical protein FRB99_003328, partial [Tulasnella sp. 403]